MSFVNLTKSFKSDSMIALTSNINHVKYSPTSHPDANAMSGSLSFEHIHPRNRNNGIKNFYIRCDATFKYTLPAETSMPDIRYDNFNAALYNTQISLNSLGSIVEQPYINNIIKRNFDKDDYLEDAANHNSKYVTVVKEVKDGVTYYNYKSISPLYHPILEGELAKVSELNIQTMVNLYGVINAPGLGNITIEVSKVNYSVYYDEVQYSDINDTVDILVPLHQYYYDDKHSISAAGTTDINLNVRDVIGCPMRAFVVAVKNINTVDTTICKRVKENFKTMSWDVAGIPNQYATSDETEIYLTSRNAGLLTEYGTYCNIVGENKPILEPICAIKLTDRINAAVGTADLFRLVATGELTHAAADNSKVIIVYEYNKLYHADDMQQSLYNNLPQSINELIEADFDEYSREIEDMMGGSKLGDWFRSMKDKMKKNRTLSKILGAVANSSKFNNVLSLIPGVGSIAPIVQNAATQLKDVAENAGYSTSMF